MSCNNSEDSHHAAPEREPKEGSTFYDDYKILLEGRRLQSRRQTSQTVQERNL